MPHINDSRRDLYFASGEPIYPEDATVQGNQSNRGSKHFFPPPTIPPLKTRVRMEDPPHRPKKRLLQIRVIRCSSICLEIGKELGGIPHILWGIRLLLLEPFIFYQRA